MCLKQLKAQVSGARRRLITVVKPLLPHRKGGASARLNLNSHWSEFEQLYAPTTCTTARRLFVRSTQTCEINDNALNEAREAALENQRNQHLEDLLLLTPPPTPENGLKKTFDFSLIPDQAPMELPLTPASPVTDMDVFQF